MYYLYVNSDQYLELLQLSPFGLVMLSIIPLASPLINGAINAYLFQCLGADISYQNGILLASVSSLANQLPISGGVISKAFYLKYKYNLSYTRYVSASLALFVCFIAVNGLIGTSILLYWSFVKNMMISRPLLAGFVAMTVFILVLWLPIYRIRAPKKIHQRILQAVEGWTLIGSNLVLVLKLVGLQTGLMLLLAVRYWLTFHMLSQDVGLGEVVLISSASVLTQLASFAPGGLGVREAIVGAVASALGFDMGVSVVAVGLDRLVSTVVILIVGGIGTVIMGKQLSDISSKSD